MHYFCWKETSANVLTEWLDLESGLLCFDNTANAENAEMYSAFWNVDLPKCGFGQKYVLIG